MPALALEKTAMTGVVCPAKLVTNRFVEGLLGFLGFFRARAPIVDAEALADFIDQHAAFLMQKGIYEYSRAPPGIMPRFCFANQGSPRPWSARAGGPIRSGSRWWRS
jgi:hypothetical protein